MIIGPMEIHLTVIIFWAKISPHNMLLSCFLWPVKNRLVLFLRCMLSWRRQGLGSHGRDGLNFGWGCFRYLREDFQQKAKHLPDFSWSAKSLAFKKKWLCQVCAALEYKGAVLIGPVEAEESAAGCWNLHWWGKSIGSSNTGGNSGEPDVSVHSLFPLSALTWWSLDIQIEDSHLSEFPPTIRSIQHYTGLQPVFVIKLHCVYVIIHNQAVICVVRSVW